MLSVSSVSEFRDKGFVACRGILERHEIRRGIAEAERLQRLVADWEHSSGDFNLEAPDGGYSGQRERVTS